MENDAPPNPLEAVLAGDKDSLAEAGVGLAPTAAIEEVGYVEGGNVLKKSLPVLRVVSRPIQSDHLFGANINSTVQTDPITAVVALPPVSGQKAAMGLTIVRAAEGGVNTVNQGRVVNTEKLLAEARKITDKKYLTYFRKVPKDDELKNGPMGMNIYTFELVPSAVGKDIAPRFGVVTVAFFTKDEAVTQSLLDGWKSNLENIDDACVGDDALKARVVRAVDKVVKQYAGDGFFLIDSLQVMLQLKKRYDAVAQVKILIRRFTKDIDTCIDTVMAAELAKTRQEEFLNKVNRESLDPTPSSDDD